MAAPLCEAAAAPCDGWRNALGVTLAARVRGVGMALTARSDAGTIVELVVKGRYRS